MLSIPCPECGPRDEIEFHYGGQAHVAYPADPHSLDDRGWAEYLFYRDNPRLDFTQLEGLPGVHFTHARGFVAKTSVTDVNGLKALLARALVAA